MPQLTVSVILKTPKSYPKLVHFLEIFSSLHFQVISRFPWFKLKKKVDFECILKDKKSTIGSFFRLLPVFSNAISRSEEH